MPTIQADALPGAAALLRDYHAGAFFLASPTGVLLADDLGTRLTSVAAADAALAAAGPGATVVGAVPFDLTAPARLAVAGSVRRGAPWHHVANRPAPPAKGTWTRRDADRDVFLAGVRKALARLDRPGLRKVVLARALELTYSHRIEPGELLAALADRDPYGYTFAVDLSDDMGDRTLLGASPELLVSRRGSRVLANPLAGSAPRDQDPVRDGRNATALLSSVKDRREHDLVVAAVADGLAPLCRSVTVPEPELLPTRAMWHLSTQITGEVADGVSAFDLATALHPTPAVCGDPTGQARDLIGELEPFDRGFYTGLVGWSDAAGDGDWVVTIRCGEVSGAGLRLYAGAGIVPGSTPDAEFAETAAKFRTFLSALGVEEDA
ncbi:MAG: isochorismate synthase [Actinophytocola sp.]|uniref:isochorismate synthase n=1 Tax=Actinophytocola sp. TaxID=1872138 RepID=UPI003C77ED16